MYWRSIAARPLESQALFLLTALIVTGTVTVSAFGRLTDVSPGSVGALVLLGAVVLAVHAAAAVEARRPEIAMARLRGIHGLPLLGTAVAAPAGVVLGGVVLGVVAGWLTARIVVGRWLPAESAPLLAAQEWWAVAAVTALALVAVVWSAVALQRTPLLDLLAGRRPRRAPGALSGFLPVLLIAAAVVSIYQAQQAQQSRVDWVSLVSPPVIGLAAGQLVVWGVQGALALWRPSSARRGTGRLLAGVAVLRRLDAGALVRLVVAAGVLFGVAASASGAAANWRELAARLQVGAPVSYRVPAGALQAYAAAQAADPQGQWLVPVAAYTDPAGGADRRVLVDTARWPAVLGDFLGATPAGALTDRVSTLAAPRRAPYTVGRTVTATVASGSLAQQAWLRLTVEYVNDAGDVALAHLPLRSGAGQSTQPLTRFARPLADCRLACSVIQMDVDRPANTAGDRGVPLRLAAVTFAGEDLLRPGSGVQVIAQQQALRVRRAGRGLVLRASGDRIWSWTFARSTRVPASRAVTSEGFALAREHGHAVVPGVDGTNRPVTVVAQVPALPFVGTSGALVDLGTALVGAASSIPATRAKVLAREDTPAAVLARLRATGAIGRPTTYDGVLRRLSDTPRAQSTRLYELVAAFSALIVVLHLLTVTAGQAESRRREVAALRVSGCRRPLITSAQRSEAAVLAALALVGVGVGAWVASRALLPALPLVSGWAFAPPLDDSPRLALIVVGAAAAALLLGLTSYGMSRRAARSAAPRILREDVW